MNSSPNNTHASTPNQGGALTIALFVGLFIMPVLFYGLGPEFSNWKAAKAIIKHKSGQEAQAIQDLEEIISEHPDVNLKIRLTQWYKAQGDTEPAIELCNEILSRRSDQVSDTVPNSMRESATFLKADCQIISGNLDAAMKSIEMLLDTKSKEEKQGAYHKNTLAYYRALCRKDLKLAIEDMNSVIRDFNPGWTKYKTSFLGRVIIATGLVSRQTNQREMAIGVIETRLGEIKQAAEEKQTQLMSKLYELMHDFVPLNRRLQDQVDKSRQQVDRNRNEVIVLQSLLALLMEEQGRADESMRLRNRVAALDFDCEEILKSLPTEFASIPLLRDGSTLLDTRGYLHFVRGEYKDSLRDMDLAIASCSVFYHGLDSGLQNTTELINVDRQREALREQLAVLYYHRMQIHDVMANEDLAEADRKQIIELGFEPGPWLL